MHRVQETRVRVRDGERTAVELALGLRLKPIRHDVATPLEANENDDVRGEPHHAERLAHTRLRAELVRDDLEPSVDDDGNEEDLDGAVDLRQKGELWQERRDDVHHRARRQEQRRDVLNARVELVIREEERPELHLPQHEERQDHLGDVEAGSPRHVELEVD